MRAIDLIAKCVEETGYASAAIRRGYAFADVLEQNTSTRHADLAVFTQTPPSYRSAAFAAAEGKGRRPEDVVTEHRALGAPLMFVIDDNISLWQVHPDKPPRLIDTYSTDAIPALFDQHRSDWHPEAIRRAKSIGAVDQAIPIQLDFVDAGLLPAIEGEIHVKLDRLLAEALEAADAVMDGKQLDDRILFRTVFRLLAAKVLQDREHNFSADWDTSNLSSVLSGIEKYYNLGAVSLPPRGETKDAFVAAWEHLRTGINFSNISSDDLAFVYENTLVTPETRKHFGTHSTPRQVAEYIVRGLELWRHDPATLHVYEPFAGAGVFLVSALRHIKENLPSRWSERERHDFLLNHISGDEKDPFACEVATLSLILADYPNHNGWHIRETDLYTKNTLDERMRGKNVILCNPPFEAFLADERALYSLPDETYSKPMLALSKALDAKPLALGFVLPRPFILGNQYSKLRRRIEETFGEVEVVELPDRTFGASDIEAAAVIAREPRPENAAVPFYTHLTGTTVSGRERLDFLKMGRATDHRKVKRYVTDHASGNLWVPPLNDVWEYLSAYKKLDSIMRGSRGLEWTYSQSEAFSEEQQEGYKLGVYNRRNIAQFQTPPRVWLDYREENIRVGYGQEWDETKIIINSGRRGRGPWRMAASLDSAGLLYTQQFYGFWPLEKMDRASLLAITALLNGPVANAFIALHSPQKVIRKGAIYDIPVPPSLPYAAAPHIEEYLALCGNVELFTNNEERLEKLLTKIDAAVLDAYDLPPRLEAQLLSYFVGFKRPVKHRWTHWDEAFPGPGLRLSERLSGKFDDRGAWISEILKPLPDKEAALLREWGTW
ncbi:hypothetical protein TH25_24400 [Thalassospira profundimaris]|uniref:site-specific DNA-methyltransferase (adenine-specific) n=1 Tax=Thalassospira profundimaris TaxID=502049 RepID=A0A367WH41_9PROT|nr:hypothetical protein TH25_24400 [Thalassospira profundimaris]